MKIFISIWDNKTEKATFDFAEFDGNLLEYGVHSLKEIKKHGAYRVLSSTISHNKIIIEYLDKSRQRVFRVTHLWYDAPTFFDGNRTGKKLTG